MPSNPPVKQSSARRLLEQAYDAYARQYGPVRAAEGRGHPLHRLTHERWWPLLAALEDDAGRKTRVFREPQTSARGSAAPTTALDAVYQCIDEHGSFTLEGVAARLPSLTQDAVRAELRGAVFQLGPDGEWRTREQYLSGDVVGKLEEARRWAAVAPDFAENVAALSAVQPERVSLRGADGQEGLVVPLGAPWVPPEVYRQFFRHLFPAFDGHGLHLEYITATAAWCVEVTNRYMLGSVENTRTLATTRMTAVDLIQCGLQLRLPVVYDETDDGRVKNGRETELAQAKLHEIRERWSAWLPQDPDRGKLIEDAYNARFNRVVPRPYDGARLTFPSLALTYKGRPLSLRQHQVAGALRMVERGEKDDTCMLAYYPGAGKTLTCVLGVIKRLQLGLSRKCVIVVPKSVLHQWQREFHDLYPDLAEWLLAGTDRAFSSANRRRFLAEAALGDARVILLTYEQFRTVPVEPATFRAYLQREVADLESALGERDEADPATKGMERQFKQRQKALADFEAKYESKWEKVRAAGDAPLSWERWNVDLLCIDEFHSFKNDICVSRMDGVSGLPRGESQRAFDMRVKLHYVTTPELFVGLKFPDGHRGKAVALTGTPVTNSLAETWIMLRHLQPRLLRELGLWHFDAWAGTFTTQHPSPEMDAVGAWRVRTRLKFHNLPELQDFLGLCWDRVDPKLQLGTRPSVVGGRLRVVEVQGTDELRRYTLSLADRAEKVKRRQVEPEDDNMLKITHDGRCASVFNGEPLDHWPTHTEDDAGDRVPRRTKVDALAEVCWELYCHSDASQGVQLVFCDLFTPREASAAEDAGTVPESAKRRIAKAAALAESAALVGSQHEADAARRTVARLESQRAPSSPQDRWERGGIYAVIRDKLVAAGMLAHEVAYIHDAATDEERAALFAAANAGKIRVLIGSTQKMGLGVNVQQRAYAAHHLTVPWRPDWLDQANKRVDRDGNTNEAVHLVCYVTVGSYDTVLWQMIEVKSEFVSAINSGTYAQRSADDIGDLQIDATTAKAIALGDLRIVEKVRLELELGQLQRSYKVWRVQNLQARHELESLPRRLAESEREVADLRALQTHRDAHQLRSFAARLRPAMVSDSAADPSLVWNLMTDRAAADGRVHVLAESLRHRLGSDGLLVGQYRGLDLLLVRDGQGTHLEARLGPDGADVVAKNVGLRGGIGAFAQLESSLACLETQVHRLSTQAQILQRRLETLRAEAPAWHQAQAGADKLARYDALCAAVATAGIVDRQKFSFT